MKKENRKAAQEKRAREREAEVRRNQMKKTLPAILGIIVAVVLIVGIVMTSGCVGTADSDAETITSTSADAADTAETTADDSASEQEGNESDEEASTPALDTTEGLVAEDGDTVNIDYVGKVDDVAFDGGSTNGAGADLVLGSGTYIDGFEEQVVGHAVGETFDIQVTFPEDYWSDELAGQEAVFTITLNGIYK